VIQFLRYEATHYHIHANKNLAGYFKEIQQYHNNCHTKKGSRGYGLTFRLWDKILGTDSDKQ